MTAALTVSPFAGSDVEWDRFMRAQPGFTHCHLSGWGGVIGRTFGHAVERLAVVTPAGEIDGLLALVRVRGPIFGDFLVSMPFLNYGGPLGSDAAVQALATAAVDRARAAKVDLLELRCRSAAPIDLPVSHRKVTVVLPLPSDPAVLFKQFDAKLRSQVRKPQKEQVEVRIGSDQVDDFYLVFAQHMRDLGTPVLPRRLFHEFVAAFGADAMILVARHEGRPIAAGCGLFAGGEFEMIWASALHAESRRAPNMLIYWRAMEESISRGMVQFNFGRCTVGAGTHRFKRQWTGAVDEPLHWYQFGKGAEHTPSPDDARYAWGPRIWQRLPLAVANLIGPAIIKGIP